MDNRVLRDVTYGVYVITVMDGDRPTGCVANSFVQVTSEPQIFALCLNHNNYTTECIKRSHRWAVSILAEDSDTALFAGFGFRSGRDVNKFDDFTDWKMKEGVPVINSSTGYMVFEWDNEMETRTHTMFFGRLVAAETSRLVTPMTYAYYHAVVKGSAPKNAPTYIENEDSETAVHESCWQCALCGHIYKGDIPFEELPDDWCCPVCGQPKSAFELRVQPNKS